MKAFETNAAAGGAAVMGRWKYRLIAWFFDKPDALARRVQVEEQLLGYVKNGKRPTPEACLKMAQKLGVPEWRR